MADTLAHKAALQGQDTDPPAPPARVLATPEAVALIAQLHGQHGPLMFHQSGGCCDGSAPMCFARGEFLVGDSDVLLGHIGDEPFYMSRPQFAVWEHTQITVDVVRGGGGMFSLERPTGQRFLIRSRPFTQDELQALQSHPVA
jgi:hypothetical protein